MWVMHIDRCCHRTSPARLYDKVTTSIGNYLKIKG